MSWNLIANADRRKARETVLLKPASGGDLRVALGYPNVYSVGMSNLGMQVVYGLFNGLPGVSCERFYLPDPEELQQYRQCGRRLFTLESQRPVCEYDVVAFTVAYEHDYTNLLQALDLAGLPLRSARRQDCHPLVLVGGPITMLNPEPIADFVDCFCVGEGEDLVAPLVEILRAQRGHWHEKACLQELHALPGLYVPALWEPLRESGCLQGWRSHLPGRGDYLVETECVGAPEAGNALPPPEEQMAGLASVESPAGAGNPIGTGAPSGGADESFLAARTGSVVERHAMDAQVFRDTISTSHILTEDTELGFSGLTEISRGCFYSCRFCTVGYSYRGVRWKPLETVLGGLERLRLHTDKIGLISAAAGNYPHIEGLCAYVQEMGLQVAFSSLRVDQLPDCLLQTLVKGGARTLTLAPEVGSDSLRRSINKLFTDEQYLRTVERVFQAGVRNVRMYAMIGLPGENLEHLDALVDLAQRTRALQVKSGHASGKITLSAGQFIPKPMTPYQWSPMLDRAQADKRFVYLERALAKVGGVHYAGESSKWALIQGLLARGDRRFGQVLEMVYRDPSFSAWKQAIKAAGLSLKEEAYGAREDTALLPWDHLGGRTYKKVLWRENQRAQQVLASAGVPKQD